MSTRMANVTGTRTAGDRVTTHRENRSMLQTVAAPNPLPILSKEKKRLLEIIKEKSLLTGREFKLASGSTSNYYLDMKPTTFDPEGTNLIANIIYNTLKNDHDVNSIGGLEVGAIPVISIVCMRSWPDHPLSGFMVRKLKKGHGTDKKIDGNFKDNSTVVLFDDVTTTGGSVLEAVHAVRARGAKVKKIITIVDRQEGATENLKKEGIDLVAIFTTHDLLSQPMSNSGAASAECLRRYFNEVANTPRIGGAAVLKELSDLASASIYGKSAAQDAVAFALSAILSLHSEDRDERPVTGDDSYLLLASGAEYLSEAVQFIEQGGSSENATRIIAALARLTPDRLYGRWPPKISSLGGTAT